MREAQIRVMVTEKERKIIDLIRNTGFGELKIIIQDKEPVRIEEITKSIKL